MIDQQPKTRPADKRPPVMSDEAFAQWGVGHLAYIKPMLISGQPVVAICAADGSQIGLSESADVARAAAFQHSLEAVSVH